jgi:hypothetical protein
VRPTERRILLAAAVLFGAFFLVAFVFRRLGVDGSALSVVGGVLAYAFLAAAAVIVVRGWRTRGTDVEGPIRAFLHANPTVVRLVGRPVRVGPPEGEVPTGGGPGQANLSVPVSGPGGGARVDLVMARLGRRWEVLSGQLTHDGSRVPLEGAPEH